MRRNWPETFLLMRLWLSLVMMDIRLRLLHHGLNRSILFPLPQQDDQCRQALDAETAAAVERLARLVSTAARFHGPFNLTCLRQALVLRSRLRALGVTARLLYGVKKENGNFSAHAWLKAGDTTINDTENLQPLGEQREEGGVKKRFMIPDS